MPASRKATAKRVEYLREHHAQAVQDKFIAMPSMPCYERLSRLGSPAVFDFLLAFDPTPKAIYLQTIIRWFTYGSIHLEDGRRTRSVLAKFHADKRRLDVSFRDVNRFASPGDIEAAFRAVSGGGAVPFTLVVPPQVLAEGPLVASGDDWGIFSIEGPTAATWWADSTSWCTRHPVTFANYLRRGPIYVIEHRGIKAQVAPGWNQFMDTLDRPLTIQGLTEFPADAVERMKEILLSVMSGGGKGYTVSPVDFYLRLLTGGKPGSLVVFKDGIAIWLLIPYKDRLKACPLVGGLTTASIDDALSRKDFIDLGDMDDMDFARRASARHLMSILMQGASAESYGSPGSNGYEFGRIDDNLPGVMGRKSNGKRWNVFYKGKLVSMIEQRLGLNEWGMQVPRFSLQDLSWLSDMDIPVSNTVWGTRSAMPKGPMVPILQSLFETCRPDNEVVLEYGRVVMTDESVDRWFRREPPDEKQVENLMFDCLDGLEGEIKSTWVIDDVLDMVIRDSHHAEEISVSKRARERNWRKRTMVLLDARRPSRPVRWLLAARRSVLRLAFIKPLSIDFAKKVIASMTSHLRQLSMAKR